MRLCLYCPSLRNSILRNKFGTRAMYLGIENDDQFRLDLENYRAIGPDAQNYQEIELNT